MVEQVLKNQERMHGTLHVTLLKKFQLNKKAGLFLLTTVNNERESGAN